MPIQPIAPSTNSSTTPPLPLVPTSSDSTDTKVRKVIIFFFVGTALLVTTTSVGVIVYGLGYRVSTAAPLCACLVTAFVFGISGELLTTSGTNIFEVFKQNLPLPGQPPGFKNEGNTCFINASLQGILSLPFYRDALQKVAKEELGYYTAWEKLCDWIESKKESVLHESWTAEEIKGIFICLTRSSKIEDLISYLEYTSDCDNLLIQKLQEFINAAKQEKAWPAYDSSLVEPFTRLINALKQDKAFLYFFNLLPLQHAAYQAAFQALHDGIENYIQREKVLKNDFSKSDSIPWQEIVSSVKLNCLRYFLKCPEDGSLDGNQEDAGEIVTKLLSLVPRYEYLDQLPYQTIHRKLTLFTSNDETINQRIQSERERHKRCEKLPEGGLLKKQETTPFIHLSCPVSQESTGQDLLDQQWGKFISNDLSDEEKSKNLCFFAEGNYYVSEEKYSFEILPENLVIQLKRFAYDQKQGSRGKINTKVTFTDEITLQGQIYHISAIAVHIGSMNGGHYTALKRDKKSGQWWQCNDDRVTLATKEQINQGLQEGYIYFLEKNPTN